MNNLQIGDNDMYGNRFNGHDLHLYLNEKGIESKHLVWEKHTSDSLIRNHKFDSIPLAQIILSISYGFLGIMGPRLYKKNDTDIFNITT